MRRLPRIVAESRIGEDVPTEIWRKGERITLQVAVGELNETEGAETAAVSENGDKADEKKVPGLGMSLSAMTHELRHRPEIAGDVKGVVVKAGGERESKRRN